MSVQILPDKVTTHFPRTVADGTTQLFLNYKLGALICFNINAFIGNNIQMYGRNVQHPSKFSIADVDIKTWAQQLSASGKIKYCYLTCNGEMGFSLYPSRIVNDSTSITLPGITIPSMTVPAFRQYNVGASANADQNIIGKFYHEFKKVGIEPGLYFNIERGYNHTARSAYTNVTGDNYRYFREMEVQLANEMYEIYSKYPMHAAWFDTDPNYPINNELFYNAIKQAVPQALVVYNSYADPAFAHFPYDVKAIEYYAAPANGNPIYSTAQTHNGTTYYIPKSIVTTVLDNQQYFYINPDYLYDQPAYTPGTLLSQAQVQAVYDKATANSTNCLLSVYADKNGVIPQAQVDLISNLTV